MSTKLFQTHGDHIEAIMPTSVFMKDYLQRVLSDSKVYRRVRTVVSTDEITSEKTDVVSLLYGQGNMGMLSLIAYSPQKESNIFMSTYPLLKGKSIRVIIDDVLEWDNGIEATICCSVGDFRFAFFAIDYYENKKSYVAGDSISMDVSALGCKVKEASRGFSFEGQQAVDWLAKIGQKPDIDQSGNIQPVKFSTEKLVAFLNHDERCPDEAEFQSPITSISSTSLFDVDFYSAEMTICRSEDGEDIKIPLYFRRDMFPTVKENDPVSGWIWVLGQLTTNE